MTRRVHAARSLVVALALIPMAMACAPPGPKATVVSVGDGDTLRVRQGEQTITVRLACIDAPEMTQRPHGLQAREVLKQRLPIGLEVTLDVKTTDRYGRIVAEVFSGTNIGLALVEDGRAFAWRRYLDRCNARAYLAAEERASTRRSGIWREPGGITRPWDFRRSRHSSRGRDGTTSGGHRRTWSEIGSHARAEELLPQEHTMRSAAADRSGPCTGMCTVRVTAMFTGRELSSVPPMSKRPAPLRRDRS